MRTQWLASLANQGFQYILGLTDVWVLATTSIIICFIGGIKLRRYGMKRTLEEYIATLSEAEKEQHKELIEDCLRRKRQTKEATNQIRNDLKSLSSDWKELQTKSKLLLDSIKRLNSELRDIYLVTRSEPFVKISAASRSDDTFRSMN
jgi:predicted nuclease with TOPRIM domain